MTLHNTCNQEGTKTQEEKRGMPKGLGSSDRVNYVTDICHLFLQYQTIICGKTVTMLMMNNC